MKRIAILLIAAFLTYHHPKLNHGQKECDVIVPVGNSHDDTPLIHKAAELAVARDARTVCFVPGEYGPLTKLDALLKEKP